MVNIFNAFGDKKQRRQLFRYWLSDLFFGALNFLGFYLLRRLPTRTVSIIGALLAPIAVSWRFPKAVQRAKNNLAHLKPGMSQEARDMLLNALWQNIGRVYAEFAVVSRIWREGKVKIANEKYLLQIFEQGRPIILFSRI